jgi:hypothetical protein
MSSLLALVLPKMPGISIEQLSEALQFGNDRCALEDRGFGELRSVDG